MNKTKSLIIIALHYFLISCGSWGGGGGVYYPPKIAINTIKLQKIPLPQTVEVHKMPFPSYEELSTAHDKARKLSLDTIGKELWICQQQHFQGQDLILARDKSNTINIYDANSKVIKSLHTPRYAREIRACRIFLASQEYLVIFIDQQSTSHSSTIFVLDQNFEIQYQEHLLGAEALAYGHSKEYGNFFVIYSENFWYPQGYDEDKANNGVSQINGNWLYHRNR